ncbi:hypothetical protein [Flavobacterium filum]|uniref:hypothetical protein n=1 Tax=Flavobacterium filum TaxID=370974 RepID=UPI00047E066F|nr:hypothetical protein [Flavobacterium filum]
MTMQAKEIIEYRGENYTMSNLPLNQFIETNKLKFEAHTTAHWRGYQGYWKLSDDKLYIIDIETSNQNYFEVFNTNEPVFANWFSGIIQIGLGKAIYNDFSSYHENYLWLNFENGHVIEKRISCFINSEEKIKFGKYKDKSIIEVLKGQINSTFNRDYLLKEYLNEVINFCINKDFNKKIIVPHFEITDQIRKTIDDVRNHSFNSLITKNFFAIEKHFYINQDENDLEETEHFSNILEKILTSDYRIMRTLSHKNCINCDISEKTNLINPDINYLDWAIKNVDVFAIPPHLLKIEKLKFLSNFIVKRLNSTIFEYSPNLTDFKLNFNVETLKLNNEKFEKIYGVTYDEVQNNYFLDLNVKSNSEKFGHFLDENFEEEYEDYDYEDYDYDRRSYSEYNGVYGFDDDTINSAFEGDPENYWNID